MTRHVLAAAMLLALAAPAAADPSAVDIANGVAAIRSSSAIAAPSFLFTPATAQYLTGYSFGGVQAMAAQPVGGIIGNVACNLSSGSFAGSIDLDIFNAQPATYADNAAVTLSAADLNAVVGVIHLNDVTSQGGAATTVQATNAAFVYANSGTLYVLAIVRSNATFAAGTTAKCIFSGLR